MAHGLSVLSPPELAPSAAPGAGPGASILPLRIEGASFAVKGKPLLNGIHLTLEHGRRTVVMGPNGAGKSLLLRLCHGLLTPSAGRVVWNGNAKGRHAMLFQRPVLLRRTAIANLRHALALAGVGFNERRRRAEAAIVRFGLEPLAQRQARSLSGGEQQMLALARAAALEPEILFLDEPTSALDPGATARIEAMLQQLAGNGVKLVLVTHSVGQARRLGDEVIFLNRGRLIERTPAIAFFFARPATHEARAFLDGDLVW
jgi:tungstate transport system ATP-binding protein